MLLRKSFIFLIFIFSTSLIAQDTDRQGDSKIPAFIDTLFIDRDIHNWSARLFANYKINRFQLSNNNQKVLYIPGNPYGLGFGVATKKLILDIAFNVKLKSEEPTERFDLQATLVLKQHLIIFSLQDYQGFNIQNEFVDEDGFRKDIGTLSSGINYMYRFNTRKFSTTAMKSGFSKQKKAAVSVGFGGFLFINKISADSSIVPKELATYFNEEAQITDLFGIGAGIRGGFNITVPFFKHFFVSASLTPGIGLMYKSVQTDSLSHKPSNPLLSHIYIEGILGYNKNRFYLILSMGAGIHGTGLDYSNRIQYRTTNAKLAIGYKIRRRR